MAGNSLVKKLAQVMKQVPYIQKRGRNSFHGYNYATEADVNEKVREVLAEQNVIMLPSMKGHELRETVTAKGQTEYIIRVDMDFTFIDGDTGEQLTISMSGEGQDRGDKAIYKAISGAQKYALMKVFMIPTGDDPEGDEGVDERNHGKATEQPRKPSNVTDINEQLKGTATSAQLKAVESAIAKKKLQPDEVAVVLQKFGVARIEELQAGDVGNAVKEIMNFKVAK
ncbi:ERF family protein [Alicyclobacillus contaminans]|uniref:ERF family protein n=1 Tax=Alicyclobacillus contaminans TaxID=392016 RepID=UPI0012EBCBB0|nr:ERF family protein [Alicyclobacillus contaminans]